MSLWEPPDLAGMRVSYDGGQLRRAELAPTPLAQFTQWLREAAEAGLPEPNAMVLATAAGGEVATRTVLLKGVQPGGFTFFTNFTSRKARAISASPAVSLLFPWFAMHRQVCVIGTAELLGEQESAEYFHSRPRGSQLAAWASRQSSEIPSRAVLDDRMAALAARWPEGTEVPMPDFWGGYVVRPTSVEFWHGRTSRMHDRLRFEAVSEPVALDDPSGWQVRRYSP